MTDSEFPIEIPEFEYRGPSVNGAITEVSVERACQALEESISRQWPRYGTVGVKYSMVKVSILKTITSRTTPKRLEFASSVLAVVKAHDMIPYLPFTYYDDIGRKRITFGPLVEKHHDRLFVIDGVHRSLAAYNSGINSICVAVIEPESSPPPPGALYDLLDVETVNTDAPRLPLFEGRHSAHFRPSAMFALGAEDVLFREIIGCLQ